MNLLLTILKGAVVIVAGLVIGILIGSVAQAIYPPITDILANVWTHDPVIVLLLGLVSIGIITRF